METVIYLTLLPQVALGTETIVRANLDFGSKKTIQDGLKNYDLIINLVFVK